MSSTVKERAAAAATFSFLLKADNTDNFEVLQDTSATANTAPALCLQRKKSSVLDRESLSQCCKWMPYCYCKEVLCNSEQYHSPENRTACLAERDRPLICATNSTSCTKMHDKEARFAVYEQKCPSVGHLDVLLKGGGGSSERADASSSHSRTIVVVAVFVVALLLLGLGLFLWLGGYFGGRWSRRGTSKKKATRSGSSKTQHNGRRQPRDGSSERNATAAGNHAKGGRQQHHHHHHQDKSKKGSSSNSKTKHQQQSGGSSKHKSPLSHQKATPAAAAAAASKKADVGAGKKGATKQERQQNSLTLKQATSFNSRQTSTVRLKPATAAAATAAAATATAAGAAGKGGRIPLTYTKFRNALK